jgi:DNA-binding NtrC family response regulator
MTDKEAIRILLIEDDPDDVWVMRQLLGDRWDGPFELVQVELLSVAIERCAEEKFDVLLLDLSLPDSQGLATFFTMYAHAEQVPIVVLSGHHDEAVAVKARPHGQEQNCSVIPMRSTPQRGDFDRRCAGVVGSPRLYG